MKSIQQYFMVRNVTASSSEDVQVQASTCATEAPLFFVHVQQKDSHKMWDSFSSNLTIRRECNSTHSNANASWTSNLVSCDSDNENSSHDLSSMATIHSVLNHLQDECSLNIKQLYERYCWLSGKYIDKSKLVCSIPVLTAQNKIVVDSLAFPRGEGCRFSHSWTQIYSPTNVDQVIGNSDACSTVLHWLRRWKIKCEGKQSHTTPDELEKQKKIDIDPDYVLPQLSSDRVCSEDYISPALLLHGPHGSGKTAAAYACAAQVGFKVLEVNASCVRSRSQLQQKLREVTRSHRVQIFSWSKQASVSLCSNTVILFDEVDVVFEEDHGFLRTVQEIISSTRCPIIITSKCPSYLNSVLNVEFCKPNKIDLAVHLSLLSLANDWPLTLEDSQQLWQHFCGDIRKAILHLQFMLSWKPTDPMAAFTTRMRNSVPITPSSCALKLDNSMLYPWRPILCGLKFGHNLSLSYLDILSMVNNKKCEVDCICQEKLHMHRPWLVTLQPSLLDEVSSTYYSSCCTVASDILDALYNLLYTDSAVNTVDSECNRFQELVEPVSTGNRVALITEHIPYKKLIHDCREARRERGGLRTRQSQHYLY